MNTLLLVLDSVGGKVFVIALIFLAFCAGFVAGYATGRYGRGERSP